jgi:hypothetical protein
MVERPMPRTKAVSSRLSNWALRGLIAGTADPNANALLCRLGIACIAPSMAGRNVLPTM